MKFRFVPFLTFLLIAFLVTACRKTGPVPADAVLFQAIEDNLQAMEKKDLDGVMATIHPKTPSFKATREMIGEYFESLGKAEVKYTVSELHVINATGNEARVSFVQRSEKIGGEGEFPNNIVHGIHTLRPDGDKWKMYLTQQIEATGLDGKPLRPPEAPAAEPTTENPATAPNSPEPAPSAAAPAPGPATPAEASPKPDAPAGKPAQ